jgi:hypothetical protein
MPDMAFPYTPPSLEYSLDWLHHSDDDDDDSDS